MKQLSDLTDREQQVLILVAKALPYKIIASELSISIKTVEKHKQSLMNKLNIHDGITLTHFALNRGLVQNMFANEPNG